MHASISVDLDEIPCYAAIHGLGKLSVNLHAVYDVALARLADWALRTEIPLTLFAIGRDLVRPESVRALQALVAQGHEVANHSLDHLYDLTRRPKSEMYEQVVGGMHCIQRALGVEPVGFRAPGYTTTDALYEVLRAAGVGYSSSVFPCPWYYAAKVTAIGFKVVREWFQSSGTGSASIVDDPRVLMAPTRPYRVGQPYWQRGPGLVELPIQTSPRFRFPFIGTSLMLLRPTWANRLTRTLLTEPWVHLELHGIDLLDSNDGIETLARYQPDVGIPLPTKLATLDTVVDTLKRSGYDFITLKDAAAQVAKSHNGSA